MTDKLTKPYTNKQYAEFAHIANSNGKFIKEAEKFLYLEEPAPIEITNEMKIAEIQQQLAELDIKRLRAVCEPELKDSENGITWLEYYNSQIIELRKQLSKISN